MLKYAEIFNNKTKLCNVGIGDNIEFYQKLGMKEMDVEQAYDGNWYLTGYAPEKPINIIKAEKITEFKEKRDSEEVSPIELNGYRWDFDEKAQMRINSALRTLKDNTVTWTSADNQEIENVTVEILQEVLDIAAIRSNKLHIKYRNLKDQIEKAISTKMLEKIIWEEF